MPDGPERFFRNLGLLQKLRSQKADNGGTDPEELKKRSELLSVFPRSGRIRPGFFFPGGTGLFLAHGPDQDILRGVLHIDELKDLGPISQIFQNLGPDPVGKEGCRPLF